MNSKVTLLGLSRTTRELNLLRTRLKIYFPSKHWTGLRFLVEISLKLETHWSLVLILSLSANKLRCLEILISFSSLLRKSCYLRKVFLRWHALCRSSLSSILAMMIKKTQNWRRISMNYRILLVNIRSYLVIQFTMRDCRWDTFHILTSMNSLLRMQWRQIIYCSTLEPCQATLSTSRMTRKSRRMHWKYLRENLGKELRWGCQRWVLSNR